MRKRMGSSPIICTTGIEVPSSAYSFPVTSRIEDTTFTFGVRVEVKVLLWLVLATVRFFFDLFLLAVVSHTIPSVRPGWTLGSNSGATMRCITHIV